MMNLLTLTESARLLSNELGKGQKYWYGYLLKNCRKKDGYKITWHVKYGELHYSDEALMQFVKVSTTAKQQEQRDLEWEIVNEAVYDFFDYPEAHDFVLTKTKDKNLASLMVFDHLKVIMSKHYGVNKVEFTKAKIIDMIDMYLERRKGI